ncbi:hypothetical protein IQ229_18860 [Nostoc cf. edaphicum LEGE 07299]|uniref:Uncharacterized protein n=1 Tax=Nostoc cf. edaphicum LEGE 07299 TaxID=2777974 RepID=A0ABR9U2M0_9NOSO|nr:hypothetical protein [Nostoc edaphicum]MBE9106911.1 hypothetical protein [Nostoc cf. edaphicum LEGE 07299]
MLDINKKTSSSDIYSIDNEQLFAQLTPEEGAVIEGGGFLLIEQLQAINADADTFGDDDTYITVNGSKIWGPNGFSTGQTFVVNRGLGVDLPARIELFDEDGFLNGSDDSLGGFTVFGATNGTARARVSGGGSTYDVYYRAFV